MMGSTVWFLGFTLVFWAAATQVGLIYVSAFEESCFFEKTCFFLPVRFTELFF